MGRLDGKVAIITGATSGMGRDTAYVSAEEGVRAVTTGRDEVRAKEVIEATKKGDGEASYVIVDPSDRQPLDQIVDETLEKYGAADILFSNAGPLSIKSSIDVPIEEWDKIMQVNPMAVLLSSKKAASIMKAKGQGYIINTGSIAGTSARWGVAAYCTSKHAMNGLTKASVRELGPEIRVNAILPGATSTAMLDSAGGEAAAGRMKEMPPLKRIGQGREIGTVALFFTTEDSSFVIEQFSRVDGGVDC